MPYKFYGPSLGQSLYSDDRNIPKLEVCDLGDGVPIGCDRQFFSRPHLLFYQVLLFPPLPPAAKVHREVPLIDGLVQNKHVTLGALGGK